MTFNLAGTHTAKREAWLRHLAETGGATREGWGVVGCQCMRLGWTQWRDPDFQPGQPWIEVLTDEGRDVLKSWTGPTP